MNYLLNLFHTRHLDAVCRIPIREILFQSADYSKSGQVELPEILPTLCRLKELGKTVIFDFDILVKDHQLNRIANTLGAYTEYLDAIRFMDPGVGLCLKEHFPDMALHLILEFRGFNRPSINNWVREFLPGLRRVVLSNQLPVPGLRSIVPQLPVASELLGCGRIEVFYSARHLIHPYFPQKDDNCMELICASEDRPRQLSPLIENKHGTLMYYDKDLYILNAKEELTQTGIKHLRLELYSDEQYETLAECYPNLDWENHLLNHWQIKTTRGFFRTNKTHVPLKRLSNKFLKAEQKNKIGVVLESVKKNHIVFELLQPIDLPIALLIFSPEGEKVEFELKEVKTLNGKSSSKRLQSDYYLMPWIKHVVPASVITPKN